VARREQARQEGFAAGLAEATTIVARAQAHAAASLAAAEPELRALAVRIAGRLLGRELALEPAAVVDLVRGVVAEARGRKQLTLRVHPDDAALVSGSKDSLPLLTIRPDPSLARGDCKVDTEIGTIDGRLASQLAAIERALNA
jgi:flagellar biosynthesis/type III secretory pathway protein FliH